MLQNFFEQLRKSFEQIRHAFNFAHQDSKEISIFFMVYMVLMIFLLLLFLLVLLSFFLFLIFHKIFLEFSGDVEIEVRIDSNFESIPWNLVSTSHWMLGNEAFYIWELFFEVLFYEKFMFDLELLISSHS